jgi:cystathionine beta-lyase
VLESDGSQCNVQVCDLRKLTEAAHEAGALVAVDNSIMTFLYQRPLDMGVDISMTSATKFIGGHSDVMAGLLSIKDEKLAQRIYFHQVCTPRPPP